MATVKLGEYLWRRVHEVGIRTVMGLPGDFNLQLLDHIYKVDGLRWVGTGNELNAAYAVDGYSRVKNVPGCLVTTHGVGELSALNGIAGSITEQVKVIHIVGQTTRAMQKNRLMIHHSIGFNPDHSIFKTASKRFRVAEAELDDVEKAPAKIDRVIRECFVKSGPVYIFLPLDMVNEDVPAKPLETPIDISPPVHDKTEETMKSAAEKILQAILKSKNPAIFVDGLLQQHNSIRQMRKLVDLLKFPVYNSGNGMGIIDVNHPCMVGMWNGMVSDPGMAESFGQSDLLLVFGRLPADTNSGGFTQNMPKEKTIEFHPDRVELFDQQIFDGLYLQTFIPYLEKRLAEILLPKVKMPTLPKFNVIPGEEKETDLITTPWFWPRFTDFLQKGDSIVAETGTSLFGLQDCQFPSDVVYNSQAYYYSIGYAHASAMGAEFARQELSSPSYTTLAGTVDARSRAASTPKRTVLITGDGSIQLSIQELGTMIHYNCPVVIVLINNSGYTVERAIHGASYSYNDIPSYDYSHALQFFGMKKEDAEKSYVRCETRQDFEDVLKREDIKSPERVMIVEIVMDKLDAPWRMLKQIASKSDETRDEMTEAGFVLREGVVTNNQ